MSLLNTLEHPTNARVWRGNLPVYHRYTAGVAGEKFLRALKDEGKLFGAKCPKCGYVYVPARLYCERDATHLDDTTWVPVGPEGELVSFSAVYIDLDGNHLDTPQWVGLVRLKGASGVLVHYLGEVKPEALRAGMSVQVVLKPANERVGSIR
ncbi:MAG: Zn-ribbon domain-containing OB-fold protein, partial [Anaerolineae bacterium]|nr:Zn-ribbon domain-containing OB-fold protein [Anaerolineae bacterium]